MSEKKTEVKKSQMITRTVTLILCTAHGEEKVYPTNNVLQAKKMFKNDTGYEAESMQAITKTVGMTLDKFLELATDI